MNLRQLECLRAVMGGANVTRAASLLGVSQPAVSGMLRSLEEELGFPLFVRVGGRLRPTAEARYLHDDVMRTLDSLDQTLRTARAIRTRSHGRLVIASYPGLAIEFLPRVVAEFLKDHPDVRIELAARSAHVIHELIPAQPFDLAIADLPANARGVRTEPITLDCVAVLPRRHPLARKRTLTPRDLDGVPFVALFREHPLHDRIARAFAVEGAVLDVVAETRFFAANCALVGYGAGVAIVDPITAADYARRGLVVRPFLPRVPYELGLLFPTERPRPLLLDPFVTLLKERLAPFLATP